MEPVGAKIAEGRDSEIFEHGPGKVLRRNFVSRDLTGEARIMTYVRERGYPVPEVFEAGDGYLVMERVNGVDLLKVIKKTPAGLRDAAATLADLHTRLGAIEAPDFLAAAPGPEGDRVVHLDLHPLNVMMAAGGPVVIDWNNAKRGVPELDVADTWAILKCAELPNKGLDKLLTSLGRGYLLREFLKRLDRDAATRVMKPLVEWRNADRNMSEKEKARLNALAAKVA